MTTIACTTGSGDVRPESSSTRTRCPVIHRLFAGIILLGLCASDGVQAENTVVSADNVQSRAGYSAGYAFGGQLANLQRQGTGVELQAVFRGILDALSGAQPGLSAAEMSAALQAIQPGKPADKSPPPIPARTRGYRDDFAALNARREGVVTLPSGVQYEVLKAGSGRQPGAADTVLVSYQASLTNGAIFDTTHEDGKPARLQLDEIVVPGLKEALQLMQQGARWRVVIPPSMGFARAGNNQLRRRDLIYDIELVAVESPAATAATPATAPGPAPAQP